MDVPCYCCNHNSVLEQNTGEMELDAALQELGMLSTITSSRLDYLSETAKRRQRRDLKETVIRRKRLDLCGNIKRRSSNSLSSAPLCVVQMNSKFVTKFSLSKNSSTSAESESEDDDTSAPGSSHCSLEESKPKSEILKTPNVHLWERSERKMRKMRRRHYMYKPYDFPWRSKLEDSLKNIPAAAASERASPPVVSRQDSGNKSNPSSPVKSQKSLTNLGSSIFRSRSLDDLEITKLDSKEDCCYEAGRAEIDTVSQRISKLHVS